MSSLPAPLGDPHYDPRNPPSWRGSETLVLGPDGMPARKVKAHNAHKAHYISGYTEIVARAMTKKWDYLCFIDMFAGPGLCWEASTREIVKGSPLVALDTTPAYARTVFVDRDPGCVDALRARTDGRATKILCADSNDPATIDAVLAQIPRPGALSLALLDPQGCNLHLSTIQRLTAGRPMDLLINFPVNSLYRTLKAGAVAADPRPYEKVLENVLGPRWRRTLGQGMEGWQGAVREHFKQELRDLGYTHFDAREVRSERNNAPLYDFMLASKNKLALKLFAAVTKQTAHGQMGLF